jgi:hypothetical protein
MIKLQGMTETISLEESFEALQSTDNATIEHPVIHGMTEIMSYHAPFSEEKTRPYAPAVLKPRASTTSRSVTPSGKTAALWPMAMAAVVGFVAALRNRRR